MFEYTSDEKRKKNRNEYSLATVYNPQGNTPTLTHGEETERGREGEKKVGGRGMRMFEA